MRWAFVYFIAIAMNGSLNRDSSTCRVLAEYLSLYEFESVIHIVIKINIEKERALCSSHTPFKSTYTRIVLATANWHRAVVWSEISAANVQNGSRFDYVDTDGQTHMVIVWPLRLRLLLGFECLAVVRLERFEHVLFTFSHQISLCPDTPDTPIHFYCVCALTLFIVFAATVAVAARGRWCQRNVRSQIYSANRLTFIRSQNVFYRSTENFVPFQVIYVLFLSALVFARYPPWSEIAERWNSLKFSKTIPEKKMMVFSVFGDPKWSKKSR